MSIYNTLQTAVSGMSAQSNKLGTIGDNIANSSTTGYKEAGVEFETLLGDESISNYQSGGVQTHVRYGIASQGEITSTSSTTDLAISGSGYFLVAKPDGSTALTRAGSFVTDSSGNLVNTAGFKLQGYNLTDGTYDTKAGTGTLENINLSTQALQATPSTSGVLNVNLPSSATTVAAANLPSANASTAAYTAKKTVTAYDNLGTAVNVDIYMTKTGSNTWEVAAYKSADATGSTGFPYMSGGTADTPLTTATLTFDPTTGKLAGGSATSVSIPVTNGKTVTIDMSQSTQLASDYSIQNSSINGNAPSKVSSIAIAADGTVSAVYASGVSSNIYKIPLATVQSPNNMTVLSGNIFEPNADSGNMILGAADAGSFGKIESGSLESSTVDLATELTNMIVAQRSYEANSKVLTTGSDMLSTIIQAIH